MKSTYLSERTKRVPPSGIRVMFEKAGRMKDIVRLEMGEPDFDTPDHIKEAAKKALDEGYTHYTSSAGMMELREALAEKVRRENQIDASPDEIVVSTGGVGAIYLAILIATDPGDEVLISDPAWPLFEGQIKLSDGVPVHYPLLERNRFKIDPEDLEKRITEETKLIIINTPNNPTGSVQTREGLKAIAEIALEHDVLLLMDEAYEKIVYVMKPFSLGSMPEMRDRTITTFTASKTYAMTGWRVGYAVARKEFADEMFKLNMNINTSVNAAAQKALVAALRGPQNCVSEMVKKYEERRNLVVRRLNLIPGITCVEPQGAFYVFPNISSFGMSSFDFSMFLLEKAHVSTVPGSGFGKMGEGYVRISYAKSLDELEMAMDRIEEAVKERPIHKRG